MIKQSLMIGSFVLLLAISWTSSSLARVECKGDFQVTKYGLIATPWCEEENIAVVARSYGWTVTGSEVRKNPLKKVYICQVLGRDIRLKGSCAGYSPARLGKIFPGDANLSSQLRPMVAESSERPGSSGWRWRTTWVSEAGRRHLLRPYLFTF